MKRLFFCVVVLLVISSNCSYAQCSLTHIAKWNTPTVNYAIVCTEYWTSIDAAAKVWNEGGGGISLTFGSGSYTIDEKDLGSVPVSGGGTLGKTSVYYYTDGTINSVLTYINNNSTVQWVTDPYSNPTIPSDKYDLTSNMIHEMGHAIGFCLDGDETTDPTSVMYYLLDAGAVKRNLSNGDITCLHVVYPPPVGIEDYIEFTGGPTTITQNNIYYYPISFVDVPPYGDHLVSETVSILVNHGEGEYEAATASSGIIGLGTLPYGYYWLRDASGNVLARVKAVGIDNECYTHIAYYDITISGVPTNTISGILTHNETWGGINNITGNIVVPSAITLKILPGATVKLPSSVSLTANGKLIAIGTSTQPITFTSASGTSPGSWGSIIFSGSGAAGSKIVYGDIRYGAEILANAVNVYPYIQIWYCTIDNNINGVHFDNNSGGWVMDCIISNPRDHGIITTNGSAVACYRNTITKIDHSGFGILYNGGSSDYCLKNKISGFGQGFGALWGSSPTLGHPTANDRVNNHITDCNFGLEIRESSYPYIGFDGDNTVYGNNVHSNLPYAAYAKNCPDEENTIYAENVYWGTTDPYVLPTLFLIGNVSNFDYSNPLPNCTWLGCLGKIASLPSQSGQRPQMSVSSNVGSMQSSGGNIFRAGIKLRNQGKYSEAKEYFKSVIKSHPRNTAAYIELYKTHNDTTRDDITKFFASLSDSAPPVTKLLLSNIYLKNGDATSAKQNNNTIIKKNPGSEISVQAMLSNFYIALYNENDPKAAASILNNVMSKKDLSTPIDLSLAQNALQMYVDPRTGEMPNFDVKQSPNESASVEPVTDGLMGNYPNPFNPTTVINYQLSTTSHVSLRVYDILGREVATLVDGSKEAGYYTASFDGSKISSGVYFMRIVVQPQEGMLQGSRPIVQVKKMLLMK